MLQKEEAEICFCFHNYDQAYFIILKLEETITKSDRNKEI